MTQRSANTVLAIIVASYLMIVVDISIVITGLPRIQASLGFSAAQLSWVTNAYTLAFGGLLLLGARAGDILGRRRMFIVGLSLFTVASMAIGVAQSVSWLLIARAIQGVGAAVLAPSTLALLSTHFAEGPERTRALSLYAAAAGVGATLGLVLGGVFADLLSWRAGFFINLPIGLVLIAAARRHIAETPKQPGHFDVGGAFSSTLGMTALVYGLVRAAEAGWHDPLALAALVVGVLKIGAFVWIERQVRQPILPLRLLASRKRAGAYLARMLFLGGAVGFWFFSTQFLQGVLHLRPLQAGLAFLPVTLPNFASAMAVPRLARRFGNEGLLLAGLLLGVIGLLWLGQADAQASYWASVAPPMLLIGLGQGLLLGPLTAAGVAGVARDDAGAASGLVNMAHQLGGALGLGLLVLVFASAAPADALDSNALAHRISAVMDVAAVLLSLALLVSWLLIVLPRRALHHSNGRLCLETTALHRPERRGGGCRRAVPRRHCGCAGRRGTRGHRPALRHGIGRQLHRQRPHPLALPGPAAGQGRWRHGDVRGGGPDGLAQPSPGADADRHRRARSGSAAGASGPAHPPGRRRHHSPPMCATGMVPAPTGR